MNLEEPEKLRYSGDRESSVDYLSTLLAKLLFLLRMYYSDGADQLPKARALLEHGKNLLSSNPDFTNRSSETITGKEALNEVS